MGCSEDVSGTNTQRPSRVCSALQQFNVFESDRSRRYTDDQVGSVLVQSHGWVTRDRVTRGNGHVNPGIGQKLGSCTGLTLDQSEVHKRSQQLPEIVHRAAMAKGAPQSFPLT